MITTQIENEIITKLPFLVSSFKNISNIITYLKEINKVPLETKKEDLTTTQYLSLLHHIKTLIDYKDSILVVSPWNLKFDLIESKNTLNNNQTIDTTKPYKVYNLENNLLYTVVDHKGVYGNSVLDKWLIQKSKNMSSYLLQYFDINGMSYTKLLVVSLYTEKTRESNPYFKPPQEIVENNFLTILNNSENNVVAYVLEEPPSTKFSTSNITINGDELVILASNQMNFNLYSKPFWLLFKEAQTVVYNQDRTQSQLIIPVIYNSLYYIGTNCDPELLNKTFNKTITINAQEINQQLTISN